MAVLVASTARAFRARERRLVEAGDIAAMVRRGRHRLRVREWQAGHRERARASARRWKLENPSRSKAATRAAQLKRSYGISSAAFDAMVAKQGGVCALCGRPPGAGKRLSIDHDHETGTVRELLCHRCNFAVGLLGDSPIAARAVAAYLERHGRSA